MSNTILSRPEISPYRSTIDFLSSDVCGLPVRRAQQRFYAMLIGFFDDSGNEPRGHTFILSGFVSTKERWDTFTEQWDRALAPPPRQLKYFKMVEANSLKGEFKGWSPEERDQKLLELAGIIQSNAMFAVRAALPWREFEDIQAKYPEYPQDPYDILFQNIMALCVRHVMNLPIPEKIEFIFDEQGKAGKRARDTFDIVKTLLPKDWINYIGDEPRHRSDIGFLPLQAADMYAWQIRRFVADNSDYSSRVMSILDQIPLEETPVNQATLIQFFEDLRERYPIA